MVHLRPVASQVMPTRVTWSFDKKKRNRVPVRYPFGRQVTGTIASAYTAFLRVHPESAKAQIRSQASFA